MKKIIYLTVFAVATSMVSCGNEENTGENNSGEETEAPKYDKNSAEYQMAEILCSCFDSFDENDSMGQMEAVGCMLEEIEGKEDIQDADEEKTKEILKDLCPETAAKFEEWQGNMK